MPAAAEPPVTPAPQPAAVMPPAELKLTPSGTDPGPDNHSGSPLDKMMDRIAREHAVDDTLQPAKARRPKADKAPVAPEKPAEAPKPDETKAESVDDTGKPTEPKTATEDSKTATEDLTASDKPATDAKPTDPKSPKEKVNPWKRGDEFKSLYEKSEAEVLRLKKLIPNEPDLKAKEERFKQLEDQNKQLLEHMRFVDFQQHPEYKEKYEKPYQDKWTEIWTEMNGVKVTDANGESRAIDSSDIISLGALPADQMIAKAKEKFGDLGLWVSERVRELRNLNTARVNAIEKAKKEGSDLISKQHETMTKQQEELNNHLRETWTKSVEEIKTHSKYGKYFNPVEGDDEFNARLEKGVKQTEESMAADPRDPNLTPEQRTEIVRKHAAQRNRASAFGVLNLTIERLEAKLAEATEKLKQFEASVPKTSGSSPESQTQAPADKWSALEQRLAGYAK